MLIGKWCACKRRRWLFCFIVQCQIFSWDLIYQAAPNGECTWDKSCHHLLPTILIISLSFQSFSSENIRLFQMNELKFYCFSSSFMKVNEESLRSGLLVGHKKQFEDEKLWEFFHNFSIFSGLNDYDNNLQTIQQILTFIIRWTRAPQDGVSSL